MEGWDHAISADPVELKTIVAEGKNIFTAMGCSKRILTKAELEKRNKFRRSLVTRSALPKGHLITEADLDAKRPGTGISPDELKYVIGRKLVTDLQPDQVLHWNDLQ
jgi:N,N'-diacetyllegionaminate synthase